MLHIEVAGDLVDGTRCANCGAPEVVTGIMLTRTGDTVVPEVAQRCDGCGQEGCDV